MRTLLSLAFSTVLLAESVAGLHWTAPAGWKTGPEKPMRAATYLVDDAECVVYFFGQGQGGGVQANVDRWKGQFTQAGEPKVGKRTIHGLPVTTIDISGSYAGMAGPMAAAAGGAATPKPGYRMLGAIVENPGGNVFLKFTGPAKTIAANQAKFEQLLNSFEKK